MVVESFKRQKISEVQALFDRANSHPIVGYFGPFRYIPAKFWATSESEMLRLAPYKDNGDRPGCVCLRSDISQALQLTGANRALAASWTTIPWITISATAPASPVPGQVWFIPPPAFADHIGFVYSRIWAYPSPYDWIAWDSNKVQLDWIRRFSFWVAGSRFIQMDEGELCFKPNNRTWHSSHRYIIYTGIEQGTLVDLTQRKFASMVAATNGQDSKIKVIWGGPNNLLVMHKLSPNETYPKEVQGALYVHDSDNSTTWTMRGHLVCSVWKSDTDEPPTVVFQVEPALQTIQLEPPILQGGKFLFEQDIEVQGLQKGRHDIFFRASVDDALLFYIEPGGAYIEDVTLTWESTSEDMSFSVPSLHPNTSIVEVRATPTFKDAMIGHWYGGDIPASGFILDSAFRMEYDAGDFSTGPVVVVAQMEPLYANTFSNFFHMDTIGFVGDYYSDHATGQLNNLVSLSRVPPTMGDQVPVPFPTKKCVSKAVHIGISANGRGLARHWKYADAKQETEFGKSLDIWLGAQGPLAREYPHTVFAVFPHRVGKREPAVTRQTDLALEVYVGNQTTPGFNTLHTMPIRAGYASGIPYFPDWVNFSNQSLAYLISTSQPPDYPDELNLEVILHIPEPTPATNIDWTSYGGTLTPGLDISAEMYNQTWNHLEETELLTRQQVNDIINAQ